MIFAGIASATSAVVAVLRRFGVEVVDRVEEPAAVTGVVARRRPDLLIAVAPAGEWSWLSESRARLASLSVVVVEGAKDATRIQEAMGAGASAYVVAGASPDDFGAALRQSFDRSLYLAPVAPPAAPAAVPTTGADGAASWLTRRELDVLTRVAVGLSNQEIARSLWVTEQTVKFHLTRVYRKLGVANRTAAADWAHRHELLPAASAPPVDRLYPAGGAAGAALSAASS